MKLANDILDYLSLILLLINTVVYFIAFKVSNKSFSIQVFKTYLITMFVLTVITFIFSSYKENNLYLSHFYFSVQFILLSIFYYLHFYRKQRLILKVIFIIVLLTLGIKYVTNPEELFSFNLFEIFITCLPISIYAIIHLYNSLSKKGAYLYINAAILLYTTTSTLAFFLGNYLIVYARDVAMNIYFIQKILYIIFLVLIIIEWKIHYLQYKTEKL